MPPPAGVLGKMKRLRAPLLHFANKLNPSGAAGARGTVKVRHLWQGAVPALWAGALLLRAPRAGSAGASEGE